MALIVLAAACSVEADWQRLHCEYPAFSVEAPEGWAVRPVDGRGARLVPPEGAPVVEVVAWEALRPPATPESALAEHEAVLVRALDYRRDEVTEIVTDDGLRGLVVAGRVRARGVTEASIFCAYAADTMHVIVGIFAPPDRIAQMRQDLLERMMRSFRFEDRIGPPPDPAPLPPQPEIDPAPEQRPEPDLDPVEPEEIEPGPAPMTIGVGPEETPIGPEAPEPEMPWIQHLSPRGFSLSIPVDWEVGVESGIIVSAPAVPGEGRETLLIAPMFGPDAGGERALRDVIAALPDTRLTRIDSASEEIGGITVLDGAAGGLRLRATWAHENTQGLLIAAMASREAWEQQFPRMARIAASFQPPAWPLTRAHKRRPAGRADGLSFELADGWQVHGGVREEAGELVIDLEAREMAEDGLRVAWQQPLQPRLRDLTPLLQSLGWREGERYSVPEGGGGLLIYRRRDPVEMVGDILVPRHPQELSRVVVEALPRNGSAAALLPGAEAEGRVVRVGAATPDGRRELLYLAATARAAPPLAATCWEAAALVADAPEGRLGEATAALAALVDSAEPGDDITERLRDNLTRMLDRARRALQGLPDEFLPDDRPALMRVLAIEGEEDAQPWGSPRGALEFWREQAPDESPGEPPISPNAAP